MNAARTAPATCVVLLTWTEGCTKPHVDFWGTNEQGAAKSARELADEHADELAYEARKAARGWKGERTPARKFQVKRLHGERAARMWKLADELAFYSQDEADSATCGDIYEAMVALFA